MHETDKGWNSNAVVKINVGPVSLNNKNGKKTTANTTEDPWVPDEAKENIMPKINSVKMVLLVKYSGRNYRFLCFNLEHMVWSCE